MRIDMLGTNGVPPSVKEAPDSKRYVSIFVTNMDRKWTESGTWRDIGANKLDYHYS